VGRPVKHPPPDVLARAGMSVRAFRKPVTLEINPFEDIRLDLLERKQKRRFEKCAGVVRLAG